MKQAAIIIPTTGNPKVGKAIESALNQTYKNTKVYVVVDGATFASKTIDIISENNLWEENVLPDNQNLIFQVIDENTGANGENGHRIFAAMSFLSSADYMFFLDQDCWIDDNHVESCIKLIEDNNLDWCYSLRKIMSEDEKFICNDVSESVGKYNVLFDYKLVDTNCYCIKREIAMLTVPYFVGKFGHDRRLYSVLENNFKNFETTGLFTTNYRLGGDNNLSGEFFKQNNQSAIERYKTMYNKEFPWSN
jgi:cellulose synthase/poly-beta-1,6-N-acetylglucosamine synthase-like glycosyltransferase